MHISQVSIQNYKSFRSSKPLDLHPGFNFVTGQNNRGKTALLEALTFKFSNKPHRSLATQPNQTIRLTDKSSVRVTIEVSGSEIREFLRMTGKAIHIPQPSEKYTMRFDGTDVSGDSWAGL